MLQTTAQRDGNHWVINGNKYWCTFADGADYIVGEIPADMLDQAFRLSWTVKTGLLKGNFVPAWWAPMKAAVHFQGIMLQKGNNTGVQGYFVQNASDTVPAACGSFILNAHVPNAGDEDKMRAD